MTAGARNPYITARLTSSKPPTNLHYMNAYANPYVVAHAPAETRAAFIRRTYGHLAGAVLLFIGVECLLQILAAEYLMKFMLGGKYSWLIVLGAFMLVGWVAERWANSDTSETVQYLGLCLFVVAEAVIFVPLIYLAGQFAPGAIQASAVVSLLMFAGLSAIVFVTKKDFSFLRSALTIGGFIALGLIIASIVFGFSLGVIFSGVMILFASAAILYSTSNVLHHYNERQHVAASLSLFAAVALLFWYILQFMMSFMGRD